MLKRLNFIMIITFLLFFIGFSLSNHVIATDVSETNTVQNTTSTDTPSNTNNSSIVSDPQSNGTTENTSTENNTSQEPSTSDVSISSIGTPEDKDLQLTDILNIFLIVLGVLLFLLGIAILTQIKK